MGGREAAREQLKAFNRDYLPPEPPATVIRSIESLIEYTRQKWRYEQKREEIDNRIADHDANYNTTSERVRFLLPPGHTLLHTYRGDQEESVRRSTMARKFAFEFPGMNLLGSS